MEDPLAVSSSGITNLVALDHEIASLEAQLQAAKRRKEALQTTKPTTSSVSSTLTIALLPPPSSATSTFTQQQHFLLLLSDSALPLGSFAFSSGLESFLAHSKVAAPVFGYAANPAPKPAGVRGPEAFASFLPLSVSSYARASLPFVLAAHDAVTSGCAGDDNASLTETLTVLDDTYDATIICTVGRRASVAQGRALLSVWERSIGPSLREQQQQAATTAAPPATNDPLRTFAQLVKRSSITAPGTLPAASAHLPPIFGAVAALTGLDRRQMADVFILSHIKALASAAVRASVLGPYQAQKVLASGMVQQLVAHAVDGAWDVPVEEAGQTVPVVDLWMGRHEMLYSRIFNS